MKKVRLEDVPEGSVVNVDVGEERATVLSKGPMGVRVDITRNCNREVKDSGWTLNEQVWSSGTMVYIISEPVSIPGIMKEDFMKKATNDKN